MTSTEQTTTDLDQATVDSDHPGPSRFEPAASEGDIGSSGAAALAVEVPAAEVPEVAGEETSTAADSGSADEDGDEDGDDEDGDDNPLEIEAEVAADYLEELLDIADLDGDIDTYVDSDRAHVSIVSESEVLVGRDGQVLDALQELTRLAVLVETGQRSRLMLDVAGYRTKRRNELVSLAADAVQEVEDSAEPVHLKAMNPFERKIVHDAVAAAGLTSESEGEEPRRHVVILPTRD